MRRFLSIFWCWWSVSVWAIPSPNVVVGMYDLPVSLDGMHVSTVQCVSVESFQEMRLLVAGTENKEQGTASQVLVYTFAGQRFRVQQVNMSSTKTARILEVREWIRTVGLEWIEVDPFDTDEVQSAFWEKYAQLRFHTTGKDLIDISGCPLK